MRENAGKPMTVYDIPGMVGATLPKAKVQENIIESFRCTGVWPVDGNTFYCADFAAAEFKERPF